MSALIANKRSKKGFGPSKSPHSTNYVSTSKPCPFCREPIGSVGVWFRASQLVNVPSALKGQVGLACRGCVGSRTLPVGVRLSSTLGV